MQVLIVTTMAMSTCKIGCFTTLSIQYGFLRQFNVHLSQWKCDRLARSEINVRDGLTTIDLGIGRVQTGDRYACGFLRYNRDRYAGDDTGCHTRVIILYPTGDDLAEAVH